MSSCVFAEMHRVYLIAIVAVTILALALAYVLIGPAPPKEIRIAAGPKDGSNNRDHARARSLPHRIDRQKRF